MISGFCCKVDESCALLGYYTMSSGNSLPTGCPEAAVRNYDYSLRNSLEEHHSGVQLFLLIATSHSEPTFKSHCWLMQISSYPCLTSDLDNPGCQVVMVPGILEDCVLN
jgi:hypothetical protein